MENLYTLSVFTENKTGMVSRLAQIFTRRKINIESLTTSESEVQDVYRFTICVKTTEDSIRKIVGQIERLVDVVKALYHEDKDVVFQELALYKVPTKALADDKEIESIIRANHAHILTIEPDFVVIEKTGYEQEIKDLFNQLEPHGVLGFVRSGRVAVAKDMLDLHSFLKRLEETSHLEHDIY